MTTDNITTLVPKERPETIATVYVDVWCRQIIGTAKQQFGFSIYDAHGIEVEEMVDPWTSAAAMRAEFPTVQHVRDYVRYESAYARYLKAGAQLIITSTAFWQSVPSQLQEAFDADSRR